jgi:hypothetical protein
VKRIAIALAAITAAALACAWAGAQSANSTSAGLQPHRIVLSSLSDTAILNFSAPAGWQLNGPLHFRTNGLFVPTNRLFKVLPARPSPSRPKPGVYKSEPYSGIVIVPGPHPDDRALFGGGGESKIPTVVPDLRLVPLYPK